MWETRYNVQGAAKWFGDELMDIGSYGNLVYCVPVLPSMPD